VKSNTLDLARRAAETDEPDEALSAVAALRQHLDALEEHHVELALRRGWSWSRIAEQLGVSKQAAHRRYAARLRPRLEASESEDSRRGITVQAREALDYAGQEAAAMGHPAVGPEHLLLALLRDDRGPAVEALESVGVSFAAARREIRRLYGEPDDGDGDGRGGPAPAPISARAREVLERALREAARTGAGAVGVEHFLLGLLHDPQGGAVRVLERLGVVPVDVENALVQALADASLGAD
jgi:hypothetical protein